MVIPTDAKIFDNAKVELNKLMERAREKSRPIDNNSFNHISKKYGLNLNEMYEIMYKISKEIFPADIESIRMWINGKRSHK